MRIRASAVAVLLLCALLLSACAGKQSASSSYTLSVWYAEDSEPLLPVFETLVQDYNAQRAKGSLPVSLRAFADEAALQRALESGAQPDLLLCSHALAFRLFARGALRELPLNAPAYPAWLSARSEAVGHGFYPFGFSLPLLCSRSPAPTQLNELLSYAAEQGRETGLPCLGVGRLAPLFYQALLAAGTEFRADPAQDGFSESYVNFYNAVAEAVFSHGLSLDAEQAFPSLLLDSPALRGRDLSGFQILPLSEGALLAEGRGLAVTSREPRSQRDLPRFVSWLLSPERLTDSALAAGLIPALETDRSSADPLDAALLSLTGRTLHLPDGDSSYYVNLFTFETSTRAALALLP